MITRSWSASVGRLVGWSWGCSRNSVTAPNAPLQGRSRRLRGRAATDSERSNATKLRTPLETNSRAHRVELDLGMRITAELNRSTFLRVRTGVGDGRGAVRPGPAVPGEVRARAAATVRDPSLATEHRPPRLRGSAALRRRLAARSADPSPHLGSRASYSVSGRRPFETGLDVHEVAVDALRDVSRELPARDLRQEGRIDHLRSLRQGRRRRRLRRARTSDGHGRVRLWNPTRTSCPGVSSVIVLCSRWVPNCFAVVENVVPTATGPSVDFVTSRPCPAHSPWRVKSDT